MPKADAASRSINTSKDGSASDSLFSMSVTPGIFAIAASTCFAAAVNSSLLLPRKPTLTILPPGPAWPMASIEVISMPAILSNSTRMSNINWCTSRSRSFLSPTSMLSELLVLPLPKPAAPTSAATLFTSGKWLMASRTSEVFWVVYSSVEPVAVLKATLILPRSCCGMNSPPTMPEPTKAKLPTIITVTTANTLIGWSKHQRTQPV